MVRIFLPGIFCRAAVIFAEIGNFCPQPRALRVPDETTEKYAGAEAIRPGAKVT
jgi:hypothetical protein